MRALLTAEEAGLFWRQQESDQRHALAVARWVLRLRPGDRVAGKAALLHDVGKRHSRLGPAARSLATVLDVLGLRMPRRWRMYRRHGPLGAADLEGLGCESIVVLFAAHHPGPAPAGVDEERWNALLQADDV